MKHYPEKSKDETGIKAGRREFVKKTFAFAGGSFLLSSYSFSPHLITKTPTRVVTPLLLTNGRVPFVTSGATLSRGTTFGNGSGPMRNLDYFMPLSTQRVNVTWNRPATMQPSALLACHQAVDKWKNNTQPAVAPFGPRWELTFPLCWIEGRNSRTGTNWIDSVIGMAQVAAGDYDRYYIDAFTAVKNLSYGGYNDFPARSILSMAHENNGDWTKHWSGVDTKLINHATLMNASAAVFGPEVAALLRSIATPIDEGGLGGNRGILFRYSYMRMVEIIRNIDNRFAFNWCWTNAAANPNGSFAASSNALNYTALPPFDGGYIDMFGGDIYARGPKNVKSVPKYISGPVEQYSSWDMQSTNIFDTLYDLCLQFKVPFSATEIGSTFQVPGMPAHPVVLSDDQAYIWWKWVFEWLDSHDVTHWTMWNATYKDSNTTTNNGACYRPDPELYPKTVALYKSYFPRPTNGLYNPDGRDLV